MDCISCSSYRAQPLVFCLLVLHPLPMCFHLVLPQQDYKNFDLSFFSLPLSLLSVCLSILPNLCSLDVFSLSSSGTLYTPVSLLTCLFSPPLSISLSLSFHWTWIKFIQVLSLTKSPSASDTDCLGNHHAPVTLSHLSMSCTSMHTQTH